MATHDIYLGDCLHVMKSLPAGKCDLIYLDPPFLTGRYHKLTTRDGKKAYQFSDIWTNDSEYFDFICERLAEMRRVLSKTGSIFFHCDSNATHYVRAALNEVFGSINFRAEIIWHYKRWSNSKDGLLPQHQTIFYYSKSDKYTFHREFAEYSASTNVDQILQKRSRDHRGKAVYAHSADGKVLAADAKQGVPLGDVWEIPFLNPKAKERTGYPTQKPLLLLERIVALATNAGDVVLDPFCGSGTTCVAAKLMNRASIGIDKSAEAVELAKSRLLAPVRTESALLKKGEQAYRATDTSIDHHLTGLAHNRIPRNKGIDAILKAPIDGKIALVRVQRSNETLLQAVFALKKAARTKVESKLIVIATSASAPDSSWGDVTIVKSVCAQLVATPKKTPSDLFTHAGEQRRRVSA
jgi:site-specific DNA-methyltransferase (adenine-specific)